MKNQAKDGNGASSICREHKQKCVFVCLHKTCNHAFKIGCIRCRKDHAQHPNRLISLNQFHTMYLQVHSGWPNPSATWKHPLPSNL